MLASGHINAVLKVMPRSGTDEDAVVVKVFCPATKVRPRWDTLEIVMRIAEAGGVGAKVLATFNNGIVYTFTPGDITDPDVIPHDAHIRRYK